MTVTREAATETKLRSQRELLLASVVDVVAERGYEATRVKDLLEASGVPCNAFYKIFANKDACFLAAVWIEAYVAGDEGVRRTDRIDARTERIVRGALAESPEHAGLPPEVMRALIGGLRKMIHTRLREGREADLQEEMPGIFDWMLRYRTPSRRLRRPRTAPDDLVPEAPPPEKPRDRILAAIGVVMPAYRAAPDWPHAVAAGLHALFALFAADPALSRLGGISAYESSEKGMARIDGVIAGAQSLLEPGFELHSDTPRIAAEAVGTSIYSLMSRQVRRRGPEHLYEAAPTAAFIALAPFVGSAEAARVANAVPARAT